MILGIYLVIVGSARQAQQNVRHKISKLGNVIRTHLWQVVQLDGFFVFAIVFAIICSQFDNVLPLLASDKFLQITFCTCSVRLCAAQQSVEISRGQHEVFDGMVSTVINI